MKIKMLNAFIKDYELSKLFIAREIATKYKGSQLGLLWTIVNPLIMLSVYTLVFSQIFQAKWGSIEDATKPMNFALNLFAGLIVFNIFSESATRAPTLITSNPNFVKKIKFPLHVLGEMVIGSSLFHAVVSFGILLTAKLVTENKIPTTVAMLPLVLLPFILMCLGLVWMLSTVGVFIKDVNQVITAIVSMLMFMSPIFYPTSALPSGLQWMATINPLAIIIKQTRQCMIDGIMPNTSHLMIETFIALIWCEANYRVLKRLEKSFGDVL
jgi:lipopolysaccharide transport system permease protein